MIEKIGGQTLTLDAYGVKFYDNMQATIEEIADKAFAYSKISLRSAIALVVTISKLFY